MEVQPVEPIVFTPTPAKKRQSPVIIILVLILALGVLGVNAVIIADYILNPSAKEGDPVPESSAFNQYPSMTIDEVLSEVKGKIPILEYHIILTPSVESNYIKTGRIKYNKKTARYFTSSSDFRTEMETLYSNNFRPISLDEYLSLMKGVQKDLKRLPPESKPFVMTFDDATFGQFDFLTNMNGDTSIDPDCAVGMMIDFYKKHPDFKLTAAFSIDFDKSPFNQSRYIGKKLNILLDYGFEIVNHTATHKRLSRLLPKKPEIASQEIGRAMELFESYLGYRADSIDKICYPDGGTGEAVWNFVKEVNYNGKIYRFKAGLNATGYQAKNPNDATFNVYNISRIEMNMSDFSKFIVKADNIYKMPTLQERTLSTDIPLVPGSYVSNKMELQKVQ